MRVLTLLAFFGFMNFAHATSGLDREGNCVPQLIAENARLYTEIEKLDQITTACDAQIHSLLKESQKMGAERIKGLGVKAKATRKAIKQFGDTYKGAVCKAQVPKNGKMEFMTFNVAERAAALDKLAVVYQNTADNYLKSHLANK